MKISIITVTYNAAKELEKTILSVLNQSYKEIDYIIIDGGSTDGTIEIIKKYVDHLSYWCSEKDGGIYEAMNKGISHAAGDIIGIVNAGDYYEYNTIEEVVKSALSNPEFGIYHGQLNVLNADGSFFKTKIPDIDYGHLTKGFGLHHPTFFVRKEVYERVGVFDTSFRIAADYDFALRAYRARVQFYYIDRVLSNFPQNGISSKRRQLALAESKKALLHNGVSEEEAQKVFQAWQRKERKNKIYQCGYKCLKVFLPDRWINNFAKHLKV